jgi:rhodanese-related sulfurtransferase
MEGAPVTRKTYSQLAKEAALKIREIEPWNVPAFLLMHPGVLLVDIREPQEFATLRIAGSINVPRGILESAAEWDYTETVPELVTARDKPVILVCRSGNRTALAALTLEEIGFGDVQSMKLGIRGWNDSDLPLVDGEDNMVDGDTAAERLDPPLRPEQKKPKDV